MKSPIPITLFVQYHHPDLGIVTPIAGYKDDFLVTKPKPGGGATHHHVKAASLSKVCSDYERWVQILVEVYRQTSLDNAFTEQRSLIPLEEVASVIWHGVPNEARRHLLALHPPLRVAPEEDS